ncbi:MAG: cupredoxin domain-containing protein [Candidatus Manganitrophus sp.]|nr:cupredoxin domain-containing protein [Candidatus Manganitrophus sp.]
MKVTIFALLSFIFLGAGMAHGKTYVLKTEMSGEFAFIGADGTKNPTLEVNEGELVELIIENGDGTPHIFSIPELAVKSARVDTVGERTIIKFVAKKGSFEYFCPLPGHRRLGMEGKIICRHKS